MWRQPLDPLVGRLLTLDACPPRAATPMDQQHLCVWRRLNTEDDRKRTLPTGPTGATPKLELGIMKTATALSFWFIIASMLSTALNRTVGALPSFLQPRPTMLFTHCVCEVAHAYQSPIACSPGCVPVITSENFTGGTCAGPSGEPPTCGATIGDCAGVVKYTLSGTCSGTKTLSCTAGCGHDCSSANTCLILLVYCGGCTIVQ